MKKASDILYLVGSILSFIAAGSLFISFIAALVYSFLYQVNTIEIVAGQDELVSASTNFFALYSSAISVSSFFLSGLHLATGIVATCARKYPTRTLHIVCIVFSALADCTPLLVGAILGLIWVCRHPKEEPFSTK